MKPFGLLVGFFIFATACTRDHLPATPNLPYDTWFVGLAAPKYMEVWVESVDTLDQKGTAYIRVFGGVPSYTGKAEGWYQGAGKTKSVNNVDLPERVSLRWQSLAEPQTYRISITIPQWVRDEMIKPTHMYCAPAKRDMTLYPHTLTLGMAPGGIVKVWLGAGCLGYKEIGRYQAEVDPRGPYGGKSNGKYIPMEPENKAYVEKHGIPYGTW